MCNWSTEDRRVFDRWKKKREKNAFTYTRLSVLALVVLRFLYFFYFCPFSRPLLCHHSFTHRPNPSTAFLSSNFLSGILKFCSSKNRRFFFFLSTGINLDANVFKRVYETNLVSIVENTLLRVRTGLSFRSDRDKRMNNCPDSDSNGKMILNSFQLATEFYQ